MNGALVEYALTGEFFKRQSPLPLLLKASDLKVSRGAIQFAGKFMNLHNLSNPKAYEIHAESNC